MTVFDRDAGLGASEAASALGLDPYRSPTEVWMSKTGQGQETEGNLAMRLGNLLEEPVARIYAEQTGHTVRRHRRACASCIRAGTEYACDRSAVFDTDYPFLYAHLDRVSRPSKGEPWRVLEIKTSGWPSEEWGPTETDQVPLRVLIQVMLQMRLAKLDKAEVAALLWGRELRVYHLSRDEELEAQVIGELNHFWSLVQSDEPPVHPDHPQTGAALRRLYPVDREPLTFVTTEADWQLVSEVVDTYRAWKQAETNYETAKATMQARLADLAGMEWDGGSITWKASERRRTDWQRVAQWVGTLAVERNLMPRDEWETFVRESTTIETTRTFRVNSKKGATNGA